MREDAQNWWEQAKHDLNTAEKNIKVEVYYASAFFSQQAAEKALKALYIVKKRELQPLTHNLTELGEKLDVPDELKTGLLKLNMDYVVTLYPNAANGIPAEQFNQEIAEEHLGYAKQVVEWVKRQLSH